VGLNDREYYRDERPGLSLRAPQTVVGWLIVVNFVIWAIDGLFMPETHWLTNQMAAYVNVFVKFLNGSTVDIAKFDTLTQPWCWWQFLTYAFAHAPNFYHIAGNMLVLFFLGRDVEMAYGRREFLRIYLVTAVFAAVVWAVANKMLGTPSCVIGASGAIAGVVILYALNFPHRTLLLYFVIPIPAWLLGVLVVCCDMYGAIGQPDSHVAYAVHLAGAAFAFIYYKQQWNLTRMTYAIPQWFRSWNRPKLRIHQPQQESHGYTPPPATPVEEPDDPHGIVDLNSEVDRILEKIYREGESSLTAKERRTLETASREFQRRGGKRTP
jgi:membrane associated rhomboid family serine protease